MATEDRLIHPNEVTSYMARGIEHFDNGNNDLAIMNYTTIINSSLTRASLSPRHLAKVYLNCSSAHLRTGSNKESPANAEAAILTDPTCANVYFN